MRTKLLLSAAALAAGALTSMAQVYSANIVGYYNIQLPNALTACANQLNAGSPQNRADQVLPYNDGDNIQTWNGVRWVQVNMDSGSGTGWSDTGGADVPLTSLPVLNPGSCFFYGKTGGATTLTMVGQVPTGTNIVTIPTGLGAMASPMPYSGNIVSGPIACPLPQDASSIQKWDGVKWVLSNYDSGAGTGWSDSSGADTAEPTANIGEGFFTGNTSGSPITWTQIFNP